MFSPRTGRFDNQQTTFRGSLMASIQQQYWQHHRALSEVTTRRRNEEKSTKKVLPVSTVFTTHVPLSSSPSPDRRREFVNYRNSEKFKPSYYLPLIITDDNKFSNSTKRHSISGDNYSLYQHKMFRPQEHRNCMALSKTFLKEKRVKKHGKEYVTVLNLGSPSCTVSSQGRRKESTGMTEDICRPPNTPEQAPKFENRFSGNEGKQEKWAKPRNELKELSDVDNHSKKRSATSLEKRVNFEEEKIPSRSNSEIRDKLETTSLLQLPSINI